MPCETDITALLRAEKNEPKIEATSTNASFIPREVVLRGLLGAVALLAEAI